MNRFPRIRAFVHIAILSAATLLFVLAVIDGIPVSGSLLGWCLLWGTVNAAVVTISVGVAVWLYPRCSDILRRMNSRA
jgi:hypothetical protein